MSDIERAAEDAVTLVGFGMDPADACRGVADHLDVDLQELDERVMSEVWD